MKPLQRSFSQIKRRADLRQRHRLVGSGPERMRNAQPPSSDSSWIRQADATLRPRQSAARADRLRPQSLTPGPIPLATSPRKYSGGVNAFGADFRNDTSWCGAHDFCVETIRCTTNQLRVRGHHSHDTRARITQLMIKFGGATNRANASAIALTVIRKTEPHNRRPQQTDLPQATSENLDNDFERSLSAQGFSARFSLYRGAQVFCDREHARMFAGTVVMKHGRRFTFCPAAFGAASLYGS